MARTLTLQAGIVLHVWCSHCHPPKWKFHVVAYTDPVVRYFLINTRPSAFQRTNQTLMDHQIALKGEDHAFLRHDSVLDCSQIVGGPTLSQLEDVYTKNSDLVIGRICAKGRRAVRKVVGESELISAEEIKKMLAIW